MLLLIRLHSTSVHIREKKYCQHLASQSRTSEEKKKKIGQNLSLNLGWNTFTGKMHTTKKPTLSNNFWMKKQQQHFWMQTNG